MGVALLVIAGAYLAIWFFGDKARENGYQAPPAEQTNQYEAYDAKEALYTWVIGIALVVAFLVFLTGRL